jgi:hypothetical protein
MAGCIALVVGSAIAVYIRDRSDPYLFMDFEERLDSAMRHARSGHCDEADRALRRATQLDPSSPAVRERAQAIDRECLAPPPRPRPEAQP